MSDVEDGEGDDYDYGDRGDTGSGGDGADSDGNADDDGRDAEQDGDADGDGDGEGPDAEGEDPYAEFADAAAAAAAAADADVRQEDDAPDEEEAAGQHETGTDDSHTHLMDLDQQSAEDADAADNGGGGGGGGGKESSSDQDGDVKMTGPSSSSSSSSAAAASSAALTQRDKARQVRLAQEADLKKAAAAVATAMRTKPITKEELGMRLRQITQQVVDIRILEGGRYADPLTNSGIKPVRLQTEDTDRCPQMETLLEILRDTLGHVKISTREFGEIDDPYLISEAIQTGRVKVPPWESDHVQRLYAESGTHPITPLFDVNGLVASHQTIEGKAAGPIVRKFVPCRHGAACCFLTNADLNAPTTRPLMAYLYPHEYERLIRDGSDGLEVLLSQGVMRRPCIMCLVKATSAAVQLIRSEEPGSHKAKLIANAVFCVKPNQMGGFNASCLYEATLSNKRPSGLSGPMLDGVTRGLTVEKDTSGRVFVNLNVLIWKSAKLGDQPRAVSVSASKADRDSIAAAARAAEQALFDTRQSMRGQVRDPQKTPKEQEAEMKEYKRKLTAATASASIASIKSAMVERMMVDAVADSEPLGSSSAAAAAATSASASASAAAAAGPEEPKAAPDLRLNF